MEIKNHNEVAKAGGFASVLQNLSAFRGSLAGKPISAIQITAAIPGEQLSTVLAAADGVSLEGLLDALNAALDAYETSVKTHIDECLSKAQIAAVEAAEPA